VSEYTIAGHQLSFGIEMLYLIWYSLTNSSAAKGGD
jgi:hypothetical protein